MGIFFFRWLINQFETFSFLKRIHEKKGERKVFQSDDGHDDDDDDGRHCHTCCTKEVSLSPPGSFHPIFLTLSVEKVKRQEEEEEKNGVLILLWLWESRMESLVLFFFLFYCVPTTLLVPLHLLLYFMARWMISTKRRSRRGRTCLLLLFFPPLLLLYTCENAPAKKKKKLLPLTKFLSSWNRFKMTLIRFFFLIYKKTMARILFSNLWNFLISFDVCLIILFCFFFCFSWQARRVSSNWKW